MSTLLHPAGPEPEQTYWMRRAAVLAALVLVLALVIWALTSLFSGSADQGGGPIGSTTSAESPTTLQSETPLQTPSTSATPTPLPSETQISDSSIPGVESSVSVSPSATSSLSADATPTTTAVTSTTGSTTSTTSPAASTTSTPAPTGPVLCTAADVVPSITGATRVTTGRTVNLAITLTSAKACIIDFGTTGFEIRIYSGADRIWSSNDCSTYQPAGRANLGPGTAWGYTIPWNTKRSLGGCTLDTAFLMPGTYVATAIVSGGQPAQHVMTVLA